MPKEIIKYYSSTSTIINIPVGGGECSEFFAALNNSSPLKRVPNSRDDPGLNVILKRSSFEGHCLFPSPGFSSAF